jgi:hypothetical protein
MFFAGNDRFPDGFRLNIISANDYCVKGTPALSEIFQIEKETFP